jgi:7-cyano-7-deazaguanine reductase
MPGDENMPSDETVHKSALGKHSDYVSVYTPSLLFPIPRIESRNALGISSELPFQGVDIWTSYELSWLNSKGKPVVAIAEFVFPINSTSIVESKSFKLYLNSYNQTVFKDFMDVTRTLEADLSGAVGATVMVTLMTLSQAAARGVGHFTGECLDELDVSVDCYRANADLLLTNPDHIVTESVYSDLLKSNCPVTGQPDWASIYIQYRGAEINRGSLLKYIISFRDHQGFHESCVERIFLDLQERCKPELLTVYARYTRRGGLDINPSRSSLGASFSADSVRLVRQ